MNGPGCQFLPPRKRLAMGMEYAVYWPAMPRANMAELAVGPANTRRPKSRAMNAEANTALTGVCVRRLMR